MVILALPVDLGQFITATATDPGGNTSQFSDCVEVTMAVPPDPAAGGGGRRSMQGFGSMAARPVEEPVHASLESQPARDLFFAVLGRESRWPAPVPNRQGTSRLDFCSSPRIAFP